MTKRGEFQRCSSRHSVVKEYREVASTSEGTDSDAAKNGTCSTNKTALWMQKMRALSKRYTHVCRSQRRVRSPIEHCADALIRDGTQLRNPRINGSKQPYRPFPVAGNGALVSLFGIESHWQTPGRSSEALRHVVAVGWRAVTRENKHGSSGIIQENVRGMV